MTAKKVQQKKMSENFSFQTEMVFAIIITANTLALNTQTKNRNTHPYTT